VRDSELFQLLHVFGSREAGQVEARRDLAGHPLVCRCRSIGFHFGGLFKLCGEKGLLI
jgi:hypothetical protein